MAIQLLPRRLMGQTIRGIRNRLGMSQADFARSLGLDNGAQVARWEKGQAQPEYGTLARIATMGLVDVLVFHESPESGSQPQLTPGEAGELRDILGRMEALMQDARVLVERAVNRTAVEVLEAASSTPARAGTLDAPSRPRARGTAAPRRAAAKSPARPSRPRRKATQPGDATGNP